MCALFEAVPSGKKLHAARYASCARTSLRVHRRLHLDQCRFAVADPLLASHDFAFRNRVNVLREGHTDHAADNQRCDAKSFHHFGEGGGSHCVSRPMSIRSSGFCVLTITALSG